MNEIKRIEDFHFGETKCVKCGKELYLYFNGGELDEVDCCGYRYRTEHVQIDLVIYQLGEE